ncbi:hypothetical protein GCM10009554_11070 [Kribbella koreensis]|uniref:Uncharacterized protein n=2 Tax=Kribbella koreensis TaxID=57909 RepID=A0ABN1PJ50_9ACTN
MAHHRFCHRSPGTGIMNHMDSLVVQTAIGLILVFATLSAVVSVFTEGAARFMGLRGEYLLRGIRSLVDGKSEFKLGWKDLVRRTSEAPVVAPNQPQPPVGTSPLVTQVMNQPMVSRTADNGVVALDAGNAKLSARDRRELPSYVSGRAFARAFLDVIVPDLSGATTLDQVKAEIAGWPNDNPLKKTLLGLVAEAKGDLTTFRQSLEQWYNDHMDRVSGWYKRHVRWISLTVAAVLVVVFNVNAIGITRSLYTDEALRETVVSQAAANSAECKADDAGDCLSDLRKEIQKTRAAGLPLGWGTVSACTSPGVSCNWLEKRGLLDPDHGAGQDIQVFLLVLLGWILMMLATIPGARFWFDALSRLGTLRSTGPKPASK